jgi:hypothetical protein
MARVVHFDGDVAFCYFPPLFESDSYTKEESLW